MFAFHMLVVMKEELTFDSIMYSRIVEVEDHRYDDRSFLSFPLVVVVGFIL